ETTRSARTTSNSLPRGETPGLWRYTFHLPLFPPRRRALSLQQLIFWISRMTSPRLLFDAGAKSWKAGGIIFRRWNPRPARFFVRPALQSLEIPAESSKKLHGTPFAVQALRPKRLRRYKHVREQTRNHSVLRL